MYLTGCKPEELLLGRLPVFRGQFKPLFFIFQKKTSVRASNTSKPLTKDLRKPGLNFSLGISQIVVSFFRLRVFDSGVMVVQLQSHSEEEMITSALDNVSVKRLS